METERKYLEPDFADLRKRLNALGATTAGPHFEINILFDTPDLALYHNRRLLRLRNQEWPGKSQALLTYKAPPPASERFKSVKAAIEIETKIEDAANMALILDALGYQAVARYEKVRESWRLELDGHNYAIELDTLPIGRFVEIEGPPCAMDEVAASLGLDKRKISLKNYHVLNQEWRRKNGLAESRDLLFEAGEKTRLRLSLGLPD